MGKKTKKELVIVIPGPKFPLISSKYAKNMLNSFLWSIGAPKITNRNYAKMWEKKLSTVEKDREVIYLHWNRGVSLPSKWAAVQKLKKLISQYKNRHNIKIVGISLGGEIALEAAKRFEDGEISKLILICSINENQKQHLKNIKVINLYSPSDDFAKNVLRLLAPLNGGMVLKGSNVVNIKIPCFRHENFYIGSPVMDGKFKGKTMTEIVKKLLD